MALDYVTEHRPTHGDIVIHTADDVAPANNDDDDDDEEENHHDDDTVLVRGNKEHDDNEIVTIYTDTEFDNGNRDTDIENSIVILDNSDDDKVDNEEDNGCDSSGNTQSNKPHLEWFLPNFHFSFVSTT